MDINFGGGRFEYGAPVLTTHDGTVSIDNNLQGGEGRSITVTSPDKTFRTRYFNLSKINVKECQLVNEADMIGNFGSSAFGSETGAKSHLHYEIQKFNFNTEKWEPFNPTEGKGNSKNNVVDPQDWIDGGFTIPDLNFEYLKVEMKRDNTKVNIILPIIN